MQPRPPRFTIRVCMILIIALAINLWLFRFGILLGLVGLNVSKHLLIAYLCQSVGVNREIASE